jgi:Tfp pilus assembly protein PilV
MKKASKFFFAGFSFMEVMLSVFVLSIGIVGVMPLFVSSLRESLDIRDQVAASMLAQEGVELVQNFRDNNRVSEASEGVFDSSTFPTTSSDNCWVSYDSNGVSCDGTYRLNLDANNFYIHNAIGTSATKFQRSIEIEYKKMDDDVTDNAGAEKAIVTSMVIWGSAFPDAINDCNTAHKCVYASLVLTNW